MNPKAVADAADRIAELALMIKRTALDERSPVDERVEELDRLYHLVRRRLDAACAASEVDEAEVSFLATMIKPPEGELGKAA